MDKEKRRIKRKIEQEKLSFKEKCLIGLIGINVFLLSIVSDIFGQFLASIM